MAKALAFVLGDCMSVTLLLGMWKAADAFLELADFSGVSFLQNCKVWRESLA